MNNYELYAMLRKEIGTTGTVYYRHVDGPSRYNRIQESYIPARITAFEYENVTGSLKVKILRDYESPMDNVSIADLYLTSPINSRFHGDMVPVRTYFELKEREQGSNDIHFNVSSQTAERYAKEFKEMLEKRSIERLSFGFSKKDTKFEYNKIIFSGPCTIIIWKDGTKTMTRVSKEDTFDPEKGVAICFMKRALGHTETNKILRKELEQYWDGQKACADVKENKNGNDD